MNLYYDVVAGKCLYNVNYGEILSTISELMQNAPTKAVAMGKHYDLRGQPNKDSFDIVHT